MTARLNRASSIAGDAIRSFRRASLPTVSSLLTKAEQYAGLSQVARQAAIHSGRNGVAFSRETPYILFQSNPLEGDCRMTIKVGDKLPEATFKVMKEGKPADMTVAELAAGKKLALFAVPGAFTPTCSARHLPGTRKLSLISAPRASTPLRACRLTTCSS